MKRFISILLVALLTTLMLIPATSVTAEAKTGKVVLRTKDTTTKTSLGNVTLKISQIKITHEGNMTYCWTLSEQTVKTNATGTYKIDLPEGKYVIEPVDVPSGYYAHGNRECITVKAGTEQKVILKIVPSFTCKVKVVGSDGKPIPDVNVQIEHSQGSFEIVKTNEKGNATFKKIPYGNAIITVRKPKNKKQDYNLYYALHTLECEKNGTLKLTLKCKPKSKWDVWDKY